MDRGDVDLQKIDGKENLTDPFTKAITVKEFDDYKSKMGIRYCTDWLLVKWKIVENSIPKPIVSLLTVVLLLYMYMNYELIKIILAFFITKYFIF